MPRGCECMPRGFKSKTEKLDEATMSKVKAVNGQIGWLGGNGCPDLAAAHVIIAGGSKDASGRQWSPGWHPYVVITINPANADKSEGGDENEEKKIWSNLDEDGIIEFSMLFRRFQYM